MSGRKGKGGKSPVPHNGLFKGYNGLRSSVRQEASSGDSFGSDSDSAGRFV